MSIDDVSNCSEEEQIEVKDDSSDSSKSIDKLKIKVERHKECLKTDVDPQEGVITPL